MMANKNLDVKEIDAVFEDMESRLDYAEYLLKVSSDFNN